VTYRRQATGALLGAMTVAAAVAGGGTASWSSGAGSVRGLAEIVGHACSGIWSALPPVLQILLIISLAAGGVPLILWIGAAFRQWQTTRRLVQALDSLRDAIAPRRHELLERLGLRSQVRIIRSARPFAMTAGLLRPRIFISTALLELLEDDELEAVLLHEQDHLRHFDPLQVLMGKALSTGFFFVPLIRALIRRHQAAVELAADEYAIARQGGVVGLSAAVLKVLHSQEIVPAASGFGGMTNLRLSHLLNQPLALPAVSLRATFQSAGTLALLAAPVTLAHGAVAFLAQASFLFRCAV